MANTRERRPGQGAAPDTNVAIGNSNATNIAEPDAALQPPGLPSFLAAAGGIVRCTIIRRSDRPWLLRALAARDPTAIEITCMIGDWLLDVAERQPICLVCETNFWHRSLPIDWALLTTALGGPAVARLCGICRRCSRKSDRELLDAALDDLRATFPDISRIGFVSGVRRA
jgi:hypothetical protein